MWPFIKLHDDVDDAVVHAALSQCLYIGKNCVGLSIAEIKPVLLYVITMLSAAATTYSDLSRAAIDAMASLALAADRPGNPHRDLVHDKVVDELWTMHASAPPITEAVKKALHKLGVSEQEAMARAAARERSAALPEPLPTESPESPISAPNQPPVIPLPVPRRDTRRRRKHWPR